jgi:hypothetical protein
VPVQELLKKRMNKYGNKNSDLVDSIGQYITMNDLGDNKALKNIKKNFLGSLLKSDKK